MNVENKEISNSLSFVIISLFIIMFRGKYYYPLNPSVNEFIESNRLIIDFIFMIVTTYIVIESLNIIDFNQYYDENENNKTMKKCIYFMIIVVIAILFMMFTKCNIYIIIICLISLILIDILKVSKFIYILPSLIIIVGFVYEYLKFDGNLIKFLET